MRKIIHLLTFFSMLISFATNAQPVSNRILGSILSNEKSIEGATISLLKALDSSVINMTRSGAKGEFEFKKIETGIYLFSVSSVGYNKFYSKPFKIMKSENLSLGRVELLSTFKNLKEVIITSKRNFIEQKPGKTLINVDASPTNTGMNVLDLLEKSPGVSVDNDGNISLKGKQGVLVMIDGKPTYMSGADLAALLKSMQSSSLDQIEIMTNPPAKYDASGNSGIINIKTKKGTVKGMNGSANLGYTQGMYANTNGSVNLNYKNNKVNLFGNYNGGSYAGYNKLNIYRNFYDHDKITLAGSSDQSTESKFDGNYQSVKTGMDYYISKKNVAGFVLNANFNNNYQNSPSNSFVRDKTANVLFKLESLANNARLSSNISNNFNYKHTFDSTGRELSFDADYVYYNNKSNTRLNTQSYNNDDIKNGNAIVLKGNIPSNINIYTAKIDYVHPFKKTLKLETGLKTSFVHTDNQVEYLRNSGTGWSADDRSNHFVYDENINSAYGILSKTIKKWEFTAGLRAENTIAKGHQVKNDSLFKRTYINLFPNAGIGFTANQKNQFSVSYSRRVTRPGYDALNPFVYFLDSLTYSQGNSYLQPQFTHNLEVSHTYNKVLTTTFNYTQTNDIITQLLKQNTEKKLTYQTTENFNSMKQLGLAVMLNMPLKKWWNTNIYTNVFNNHYNGFYQNDPINIQFTSFMANMTNSFKFGKSWNAEISGWYRSKAAEGLLVINGLGAVNAGISTPIFKTKGTIKIGIRDIFYTQKFSGYAKYSDVDVKIAGRRDSRQLSLNFSYRFGKSSINIPQRRKNNASQDEQNRVGQGNNQ